MNQVLLVYATCLFFTAFGFVMGFLFGGGNTEMKWKRWCDRQDIPVPTWEELEREP